MTLDVFPDPIPAVKALLNAGKPDHWPTAAVSTQLPDAGITSPHIQHAWDGTPSERSNSQTATIRVTCWAPRLKQPDARNLAQLVRAYLLDAGSSTIWRFRRGAGPAPGNDQALELPFCTFTLTAETRPTRVS